MSAPAEHWSARAACIGLDPALFFPEPATATEDIARAKAVCEVCPVAWECLGGDLRALVYHDPDLHGNGRAHGAPYGVVAGMSASERR